MSTRSVPAARPGATAGATALPAGLIAAGGLGRLPGALVAGVGPLHGLALPVSLTGRPPARDEKRLIAEVLGGGSEESGATLARALDAASGGKFRLTFSSLPPLVASASAQQHVEPRDLRALAASSLRSWTRQLDARAFDDDGPDAVPGSGDDDGVLDFFLLVLDADREVSSVTIPEGVPVAGAADGRRLGSGPIHVLGLGGGGDPLLAGIGLVLDAAGLDGGERFFPSGFPRMISSLARVRLGWITTRVARPAAAAADVPSGEAVLIPLRDMPDGAGFWLVENDGRFTYATRAVRTPGDHFAPTEVKVWEPGRPLVLALSRQMGELGERVVLEGTSSPVIRWMGMRPEPAAGTSSAPVPVRW